MATRRMPRPAGYHWDVTEAIVRPDGKKPCRWCKGPVETPKQSWCGSRECLWEWQRRTSWAGTRQAVFDRDHGVCRSCGRDTLAEMARFRQHLADRIGFDRADSYINSGIVWSGNRIVWKPGDVRLVAKPLAYEFALTSWLPGSAFKPKAHPWEADHIVPVAEGGDWFDLSNLQTLCRGCHCDKTTDQAKRRAADRRKAS